MSHPGVSEDDCYLVFKALCKNTSDLDNLIQQYNADPNQPAIVRLRNELLSNSDWIKQLLETCKSTQDLEELIVKKKVSRNFALVQDKFKELREKEVSLFCLYNVILCIQKQR